MTRAANVINIEIGLSISNVIASSVAVHHRDEKDRWKIQSIVRFKSCATFCANFTFNKTRAIHDKSVSKRMS